MWIDVVISTAQLDEVAKDGQMCAIIYGHTSQIIKSGLLLDFMQNNRDIEWNEKLPLFIEILNNDVYGLREDILLLRTQLTDTEFWTDECRDAIFASNDAEFYNAMNSDETIFDDLLE